MNSESSSDSYKDGKEKEERIFENTGGSPSRRRQGGKLEETMIENLPD